MRGHRHREDERALPASRAAFIDLWPRFRKRGAGWTRRHDWMQRLSDELENGQTLPEEVGCDPLSCVRTDADDDERQR